MKKINAHKEILYVLSLILAAFAVSMFAVAKLGYSVYNIPPAALSHAISNALVNASPWVKDVIGSQAFSELIIQTMFFIAFCILIRKFRPFFLFAFVSTFIFSAILFGFQHIPAFNPELANYPLYVQIILLILAIVTLSISVVYSLKGYIHPPTVTFVQKGIINHYHIKKEWLLFLSFDIAFAIISIFIIFGVHHDWIFWEHGLSYGSIATALFSGPIIGLISKVFDKLFMTKTLFPKWEKAFEVENKKGY